MKKVIFALVVLAAVLTAASPVFAQNSSNTSSNMYYVNVRIEKIYPSSQGYIIQYIRSTGEIGTVGIPNDWFMDSHIGEQQSSTVPAPAAVGYQYVAAGRGEILRLPPGVNWPSMSVFYDNGKFNHVRLYVHRVKSHRTWGNIPQGTDVSRFFSEDRESLNIQY